MEGEGLHLGATEEEYDRALELAGRLMAKGEEALSAEEGRLLELLGLLVEDYDDRRYPLGPGDPIAVLTELMEGRGLTQKDLWPLFGSKGVASEVLRHKRAISKAQAKRLAAFFHVSAEHFISGARPAPVAGRRHRPLGPASTAGSARRR